MDDPQALSHINALAAEEHDLRSKEPHGLDDAGRARLKQVEVELDQCWDLLRQRNAKREFGDDPDAASVRPEGVVEGYQQ